MHDAHFVSLVLWRGTAGEEEPVYTGALAKVAWGLYAHLIRLVSWRGTAGEELAYKGAVCSDRPLITPAGEFDGQAGPIMPTLGCGGSAGMTVNSRLECSVGSPAQAVS